MGGCASKPNEPNGPNPEALPAENSVGPEPTVKPVEGDAPAEEAKAETATEEPLVDLSEPKPEADGSPVAELAPEDAPISEKIAASEEEKVDGEKAVEAKESDAVADGKKEEKASA